MKNRIAYYSCIALAALLSFCSVQKKVAYQFPEAMLPHVKEAYTAQCDKGQILYNLNCAACHTQKKGRKLLLPSFKESQLKGYELRVANAKHETSLPDEKVTEEELGLIMTFLRYKKPSSN
jgi:mono/diheme cytochrome c family protein